MYQNIFYQREKNLMHVWDDFSGYSTHQFKRYAYKIDSNGQYISMYGDPLTKIYTWDKEDHGLYESDVPEITRFLVDTYTNEDLLSKGHTILTYDIEISLENGLPDMTKAENEITAIGLHDRTSGEYYVFILDKYNKIEYRENNYKDSIVYIVPFNTERELLLAYLDKYQEINPTIVTGWNIDKFDTPYLYNRICNVLDNTFARRLSPIGHAYWNKYKQKYIIAGVSYMDYILLYKNFTYTEQPSYRLDYIAKKEIGRGKIEYEGNLDKLFEVDINKFIEYNLVDVDLVVELENKLQFIELARGICHTGHVAYEDFQFSSKYLEGAILTLMKRKGIVACNKHRHARRRMEQLKEKGIGFVGAYVKDPIPGKYDWIYDLDLTQLYPSIIMSLNISPETKVGKITDWNNVDYIKGVNRTYSIENNKTYSYQEIKEFLEKEKCSISSNGIIYDTKTIGLIPEILGLWSNQRIKYKNAMKKYGNEQNKEKYEFYKQRQHIQKILLNSLYGVLGLPIFRFYDIDNATAVTTVGQDIIKTTVKVGNAYYNKELGTDKDYNIYVDTDSCFFSALPLINHRHPGIDVNNDNIMTTEILKIATEVQAHINKSYNVMAKKMFNLDKHCFEIKQEIISKSSLWITKKRYAQWVINDNSVVVDKIDITGLDVVRSTFPKAFQVFMRKLLEMILKNVDKLEIDDMVLQFKNSLAQLSYSDIARVSAVKELSKYDKRRSQFKYMKGSPVHVKSGLAYNDALKYWNCNVTEPVRNGDKIKWVYLKNNPLGLKQIGFKGYDDPKEVLDFINKYIDYNKIYKAELESKLIDFYNALKWDIPTNELKTAERFFEF